MSTIIINVPSQVKPYANLAAFPGTGSAKTIYIAEDSSIGYWWNGSEYVPLGAAASSVAWGSITGTLSNQTDLWNLISGIEGQISDEETARNQGDADTLASANAYTDSEISSALVGMLDDRGNFDASGNVFPSSGGSGAAGAILKGDLWTISVAGTLGGTPVTTGDVVRALSDSPGQTASNWNVTENNIGYVPENNANKKTTMTGNESSNTFFLTAKAIYDWATGLFMSKSSNLSDLSSVTTARSNIGIGSGYVLVTHGGTNFTTPSDITTNTKFKITMTGGGGGGGGINTSGSKGSGGGGAATGVIWISGLTPSTNYSCVIGTGGNGGAAPGNGTDGTDTTLTIGATTYTAGGGKFGSGAVGNLGGLGGTLSVSPSGSFTFGASGQRGSDSPANSASSTDGAGGDSGLGLGTGGAPGRNGANGRVGDGYGSGGSGGHGAGATGGAGANGVIYAEYWN